MVQDRGTFAAVQSKIVGSSDLIQAYGMVLTESERPNTISASWMQATRRLISTYRVRFLNADHWRPNPNGETSDPLGGPRSREVTLRGSSER